MENDLKKWIVVFILAAISAVIYIYLESFRCDFICVTATFPLYLAAAGFILMILPFTWTWKEVIVALCIFGFLFFIVVVGLQAGGAARALRDPSRYMGFKRSGIPEHGVWVGLFRSDNYLGILISGFSVSVGMLVGKCIKYLVAKIRH